MPRTLTLIAVVLIGFTAPIARADYTITSATGLITENFDGMPSTGTTALNATVGTANALPGVGFVGTKLSGTGSTLNFIANDGSNNAGALYSYGTTGSSDRSLGTLASGTVVPAFGATFINGSGVEIDSFIITLDREQWRSSTSAPNTISFAFGVSGNGITSDNFLTSTAMTPMTNFDLVGNNVVTGTNGALDGNQNAITITGTLNVTVLAGQSLFLRWTDVNDIGNDAGLSIDNFSISGGGVIVPEPTSFALIAIGICTFFRVRRRLEA